MDTVQGIDIDATALEIKIEPDTSPAPTQRSPALQTLDMLGRDEAGELWRLPQLPIPLRSRKKMQERYGIKDQKTLNYHFYCSQIATAWPQQEPKDWLAKPL